MNIESRRKSGLGLRFGLIGMSPLHLSQIHADSKIVLQNIYSCLWSNFISNQTCDDKLCTYVKFKTEFEIENYRMLSMFPSLKEECSQRLILL